MSFKRLYGKFTKVEEQADGTLIVEGVASSETVDSQGEVVKASAIAAALPDYMKFPAVREMHQAWAAGKTLAAAVTEDGLTHIATKIVDAEAVKKVKEQVYAGFSIGGSVPPGGRSKDNPKVIEVIKLTEISLVDRPANPDAVFTLVKIEDPPAEAVKEAARTEPVKTEGAKTVLVADIPIIFGKVKVPAVLFEKLAGKSALELMDEIIKATNAEPVKKGMFTVAWAADLCQSLANLAADTQWEADYEGDNSAIPGRVKALCAELCAVLRDLVAEETAELVGDATGAEAVAMAEKPGALKKSEKLGAIAKAFLGAAKGEAVAKKGSKFSKATKAALAAVHKCIKDADAGMSDVGYAKDDDGDDDVSGAAKPGELQKLAAEKAELEKSVGELDGALAKANETLKKVIAERDELRVKLATKGVLKVVAVAKEADAPPVEKKNEPTPPPEGTRERAEYELRKVHAGGGRPLAIAPSGAQGGA